MNQQEQRRIAQGTVRSEARRQGIATADLTAAQALAMLDDLYRTEPMLVASIWYGQASEAQMKLFAREMRNA
jgi:hypothetical protein